MRRLLTIGFGALIAVSVPAGMLVEAGAANAAGTTQMTCTKLKGTATSQAVGGCSGPALIVGTKPGKGVGTSVPSAAIMGYQQAATTTWGKGGVGGTSTSGINYVTGGTACGKSLEIVETSTIVSGTGPAAVLVGDVGSATVCYSTTKGTIVLLKGTTLTQ